VRSLSSKRRRDGTSYDVRCEQAVGLAPFVLTIGKKVGAVLAAFFPQRSHGAPASWKFVRDQWRECRRWQTVANRRPGALSVSTYPLRSANGLQMRVKSPEK